MNCMNAGAAKRHTVSSRKSSAQNESTERHPIFAAILSPLELRRLVAAMVD